jgi:hypothetical protein
MHIKELSGAKVSINAIEGVFFACYLTTVREHWNGWACPYFTAEVAKSVLEALVVVDPMCKYRIEADGTFVVIDENYPPEDRETKCGAVSVDRDGQPPISLYPLGSWGWCWEEDEAAVAAGAKPTKEGS